MGPFDMLLILIAVGCIAISMYQRLVRTIIMLSGAYIATLLSVLLYQEAAFRLKAIGQEKAWFEGVVFLALFFILFLVIYLASRAAYPDTTLPKLGFLDHLLGGVVGVVVAAILMVIIYNGLGVMTSRYWEPFVSYANLINLRAGIQLGPFLRQIVQIYAYAFYPFFVGIGFPKVLQPF